ncbi:FtsW/RodA/SpoVE family cell cycle protein, partial [Amedibacillus dolichus]|uniref:FtsW/RodA/SpoVE family cell cycle protein n=1 Tax=Amedibacillus dolichus TaxID=31971 RepID=UPI0026E21C26
YAFRTKSEGYKVILIGSAMYIFLHFALNVGGVSGLIPLTGVPLLFISSGGSSLMSIMSAMGICQAIISRIRRQGADQLPNQRIKKKEA